MRKTARKLVDQFELTTALIVVFPGLAMRPGAMNASIAGFLGSKLIVLNDRHMPVALPLPLRRNLDLQAEHAEVLTMETELFGNHRGLLQPVSLAVRMISEAGLSPKDDRLLLTGCYRGSQPGSIDILAEALATLHFTVEIDRKVMLR